MVAEDKIKECIKLLGELITENLDIQPDHNLNEPANWFSHVCFAQGDLQIALQMLEGKFKRLNKKMFKD